MVRERGTEAVAKVLSELAQSDEAGALPSFAPDRLQATTRRFLDLILLPLVLRALFGEDLAALRAEAAAHISKSVAFFLAACRQGDRARRSVCVIRPQVLQDKWPIAIHELAGGRRAPYVAVSGARCA